MTSMRGNVTSLVRRAFTARRPLVATTSPSFSIHTSSSPATALGASAVSLLGRTARPGQSAGSSSSNENAQQHQHQHQQRSGLSTLRRGLTGPLSARLRLPMRGLEEFRDPEIVKAGDVPIVGRSWTVPELRKKSFEDLHKLWFVLYKEKNMLMSEVLLSRRSKVPIPAGDRRQKVKRSMKAIRVVVGERQRAKRAAIRERQLAAKREKRKAAAAAAAAAAESGDGDVAAEKGSQTTSTL
eukprot:g14999.t1